MDLSEERIRNPLTLFFEKSFPLTFDSLNRALLSLGSVSSKSKRRLLGM